MKADYWMVRNEEVLEKTGKGLAFWTKTLEDLGAESLKSNEVIAYLQEAHEVPRYWARTLVTRYQKGIRD